MAAARDLLAHTLAAALADEDNRESAGLLSADDRRTCHTCRTWATDTHTASAAHWAAVDAAMSQDNSAPPGSPTG